MVGEWAVGQRVAWSGVAWWGVAQWGGVKLWFPPAGGVTARFSRIGVAWGKQAGRQAGTLGGVVGVVGSVARASGLVALVRC